MSPIDRKDKETETGEIVEHTSKKKKQLLPTKNYLYK